MDWTGPIFFEQDFNLEKILWLNFICMIKKFIMASFIKRDVQSPLNNSQWNASMLTLQLVLYLPTWWWWLKWLLLLISEIAMLAMWLYSIGYDIGACRLCWWCMEDDLHEPGWFDLIISYPPASAMPFFPTGAITTYIQ